jgi:hypothetical protein
MYIDPKQPIAGLRPGVLKRIFKRKHGFFMTRQFAEITGLGLAEAITTLDELERLGWITRDPRLTVAWHTSQMGDYLAQAWLLPPMTVAEARGLVHQVIAAAEAINAEPGHWFAVGRLVLLGDLRDAPDDAKIAEVDLGYDTVRPRLGGEPSGDLLVDLGRLERRLQVHRRVRLHERVVRGGHVLYEWDELVGGGKLSLPW